MRRKYDNDQEEVTWSWLARLSIEHHDYRKWRHYATASVSSFGVMHIEDAA
jgi:hypothetical protein